MPIISNFTNFSSALRSSVTNNPIIKSTCPFCKGIKQIILYILPIIVLPVLLRNVDFQYISVAINHHLDSNLFQRLIIDLADKILFFQLVAFIVSLYYICLFAYLPNKSYYSVFQTNSLERIEKSAGFHFWSALGVLITFTSMCLHYFRVWSGPLGEFLAQLGLPEWTTSNMLIIFTTFYSTLFISVCFIYALLSIYFRKKIMNVKTTLWDKIAIILILISLTSSFISVLIFYVLVYLDEFHLMCFEKGTLVQSSHGTVPIENLKPGQSVLAHNLKTGQTSNFKIRKIIQAMAQTTLSITLENGEELKCTTHHPFRVKEVGWVKAGRLQAGDELICLHGEIQNIQSVERINHNIPVAIYTLSVDISQNFYVGKSNVLVHNKTIK